MRRFAGLLILAAVVLLGQQRYTGPRPDKADIPYLRHADNLVALETGKAQEQAKKDQTTYVVAGAKSPVQTPLASPMFVMEKGAIDPQTVQLFRFEVKNGHRELTIKKGKGGALPLHLVVTPGGGSIFQIEVQDSLPPGEYSLSPDGSNDVFCFSVF